MNCWLGGLIFKFIICIDFFPSFWWWLLQFHSDLDVVWYQPFSFCQRETLLCFWKLEKQPLFRKCFSWFILHARLLRQLGWTGTLRKRSTYPCVPGPTPYVVEGRKQLPPTSSLACELIPSADLQGLEPKQKSLEEGLGLSPRSCLFLITLFTLFPVFSILS